MQLQLSNDELEEKVKSRTEEIKYSEIQYRNLFENTPMPMWIFDRQSFAFLDINKQACSLYGYSKEEFLQMTVLDIRTPEEQERFLQSAFIKDIHLNESDTSIWTHVKKNGTSFQVEVHAHSVLYKGKSARLVLLNDVSERIKSEEKIIISEKRFRALIENSFDLIVLLDASFRITYRSPSVNRTTGRTDEDTIGTDALAFIHPEDTGKVSKAIQELMHAPGSTAKCLFRYQKKDGTYLWMEGTATNLLHDADVQSIVFNYRDVSEKKEAEEQAKIS